MFELKKISLILIAVLHFAANTVAANAKGIELFAVASVHFEQNATDGDVEVVFHIKGGDEGLSNLKVTSPNGLIVINFTAPHSSTFGIRQFVFESPEPKDINSLKFAYPEGEYTFSGTTLSGQRLEGKATLNHKLPATVSFIHPKADAQSVQFNDLEIKWTSVTNVSAYIIEIEQDDIGMNLEIKQNQSSTSLKIPNGFLQPGTNYALSIGTVTKDGNTSFVETNFKTTN